MTIGHRADGTTIYKYISASTQRELEHLKEEARRHYIDGAVTEQDQLFEEFAIAWYRAHKEQRLAPSSQNDYLAVYNKYLLPAFSGRMLRAIKALELRRGLI